MAVTKFSLPESNLRLSLDVQKHYCPWVKLPQIFFADCFDEKSAKSWHSPCRMGSRAILRHMTRVRHSSRACTLMTVFLSRQTNIQIIVFLFFLCQIGGNLPYKHNLITKQVFLKTKRFVWFLLWSLIPRGWLLFWYLNGMIPRTLLTTEQTDLQCTGLSPSNRMFTTKKDWNIFNQATVFFY